MKKFVNIVLVPILPPFPDAHPVNFGQDGNGLNCRRKEPGWFCCRQEALVPEGPLILLFRGGGGFRPELALALAWRAAQELGRGFAGLLYPGREAREDLMRRLSAAPGW